MVIFESTDNRHEERSPCLVCFQVIGLSAIITDDSEGHFRSSEAKQKALQFCKASMLIIRPRLNTPTIHV